MKWRVICDRCAAKRWNHELRKEWTGLMVCRDTCWESRNAQDSVRGVPDRQNPPWVRPETTDVFIDAFLILREDGSLFQREVDSALSVGHDYMARET